MGGWLGSRSFSHWLWRRRQSFKLGLPERGLQWHLVGHQRWRGQQRAAVPVTAGLPRESGTGGWGGGHCWGHRRAGDHVSQVNMSRLEWFV